MKTIEYELYQDKILGGLLGISAGSRYGAHFAGRRSFTMAPLPDLQQLPNLGTANQNLMMLFLILAGQKGARLRESDLGDLWKSHVHLTEKGFGIVRRNLRLGLYPPQSGIHNNPIWCTSMEAPARAPFWGFLNPGMPEQAAFYAGIDAAIDHDGIAVDASRFLAALTSLLYFEADIKLA
ncbi:MAG: ADP-ribosylglycohydrolase family protein, partial [Calditrichaeota bacterium]